ncbi:MAG: LysR family transcriptional regulator [Myxococcaceae bacterium]|nr:LysR family transcriptional regulator [Myxococcaceae bacterium]
MKALHQVDLNLWVVLGQLLETNHVSEAARRLGRTQSAVSHSLAALRAVFGDPLFVRVGPRLEPTPRAKALAPLVKEALRQVEASLAPQADFDPKALTRTFRVFLSDYVQVVLLPKLLTRLAKSAPRVTLDVTFRADAMDEVLRDVREGRVDLSVGPPVAGLSGVVTQPLFTDTNVCVVRAGHPFVKHPTAKAWATLRHVVASPRGALRDFVDEALEERGLTRTVVARVPHFTAALSLVAQSDCVTLVPARLARAWATNTDVVVVKPPLALPGFSMAWFASEVLRADPANAWLRRELKAVADAER